MLEMNQTYRVSSFSSSEFKFDIARVAGRSQTTDHRHKKGRRGSELGPGRVLVAVQRVEVGHRSGRKKKKKKKAYPGDHACTKA